MDGTLQRGVALKIPSTGSKPGSPGEFDRFSLGNNYYVSPHTETVIRSFRPLNNSECSDDACEETSFRPRVRSKSTAAGAHTGMRKPYFGFSISKPLD